MQTHRLLLAIILPTAFLLTSCSDTYIPTAKEAITKPLGTGPEFTLGTSKAEVLDDWGPPDLIIPRGVDELGSTREEWIYHGRIQSLPIDVEYVSRDKHLFFEGENMVRSETRDPRQGAATTSSEPAAEPGRSAP